MKDEDKGIIQTISEVKQPFYFESAKILAENLYTVCGVITNANLIFVLLLLI
jgi:hypothetical protein